MVHVNETRERKFLPVHLLLDDLLGVMLHIVSSLLSKTSHNGIFIDRTIYRVKHTIYFLNLPGAMTAVNLNCHVSRLYQFVAISDVTDFFFSVHSLCQHLLRAFSSHFSHNSSVTGLCHLFFHDVLGQSIHKVTSLFDLAVHFNLIVELCSFRSADYVLNIEVVAVLSKVSREVGYTQRHSLSFLLFVLLVMLHGLVWSEHPRYLVLIVFSFRR